MNLEEAIEILTTRCKRTIVKIPNRGKHDKRWMVTYKTHPDPGFSDNLCKQMCIGEVTDRDLIRTARYFTSDDRQNTAYKSRIKTKTNAGIRAKLHNIMNDPEKLDEFPTTRNNQLIEGD